MDQDRYLGLVALGQTIKGLVQFRNAARTPLDPTGAPTFRVYGTSGVMTNGTGTLAVKDSGVITGATNASPIVITSNGHKLSANTRVTVASVGGNTAANGDWQIAFIDSNTFSLTTSTGNGAYTPATGLWHTTGAFEFSFTPTGGNGFAAGVNYSVLVQATVNGVVVATVLSFTVT